jgi:hypothetical protein
MPPIASAGIAAISAAVAPDIASAGSSATLTSVADEGVSKPIIAICLIPFF